MIRVAVELQRVGISKDGTVLLLGEDLDEVERQLCYLPYRKARRPAAFLVEAIRKRYSPPKEFYYAQAKTVDASSGGLDENAEPPS